MKKIVYDFEMNAQLEVDMTQEEIEQYEQSKLDEELERSKPKPPTVEEKLQLLQQAMDELLLGGM